MKAGVRHLVADRDGDPRLFRADRIHTAEPAEDSVRRRAGAELAGVWETLRAGAEQRPSAVRLRVRVHRPPAPGAVPVPERGSADRGAPAGRARPGEEPGQWLLAEPAVSEVARARSLLAFGPTVEILDPPEARALLAEVAAEVVERYAVEG